MASANHTNWKQDMDLNDYCALDKLYEVYGKEWFNSQYTTEDTWVTIWEMMRLAHHGKLQVSRDANSVWYKVVAL